MERIVLNTMGMGSYDESEHESMDVNIDEEDEEEEVSVENYNGEVSYDTPDDAEVLMENFKQGKED